MLVVGGLSMFVPGHYFKIVPFLVWYHRFGARVGKGRVPRVADLEAVHLVEALDAAGASLVFPA